LGRLMLPWKYFARGIFIVNFIILVILLVKLHY
jgi:hypothetical protein